VLYPGRLEIKFIDELRCWDVCDYIWSAWENSGVAGPNPQFGEHLCLPSDGYASSFFLGAEDI
jgi:hypothetical protein